MDAAQIVRVTNLAEVVRKALDVAIEKDATAEDVVLALVANASAISKQIEIDDDRFFDMVVMIYESVSFTRLERN